jgi:hypothetical protein
MPEPTAYTPKAAVAAAAAVRGAPRRSRRGALGRWAGITHNTKGLAPQQPPQPLAPVERTL